MPKQYLEINATPILRLTIERFLSVDSIDALRVVIHPDDRGLYDAAIEGLDTARLLDPVHGGASRTATTLNGLASLTELAPGKVLIHDAARPFVTREIIETVLAALDTVDGAFAALPIVDAIWEVTESNFAERSIPRDGLWRAQTPQGFRFDAILEAHKNAKSEATDDVATARAAGLTVRAVQGAEDNYKITLADDLKRAEITHASQKKGSI